MIITLMNLAVEIVLSEGTALKLASATQHESRITFPSRYRTGLRRWIFR